MSKENRISIRLSSRHYTFLSSHPLFASHSLTEAIEICIEKTRQSLLAKQTPAIGWRGFVFNQYKTYLLLLNRPALRNSCGVV